MRIQIKMPATIDIRKVVERAEANGVPLQHEGTDETGIAGVIQANFVMDSAEAAYYRQHTAAERVTILDNIMNEAAGRVMDLRTFSTGQLSDETNVGLWRRRPHGVVDSDYFYFEGIVPDAA